MVSIHAPVRGATRHDRGEHKLPKVSIHAPVRGATSLWGIKVQIIRSFNPRARAGRDIFSFYYLHHLPLFQSTRPCGARLIAGLCITTARYCFNPRARAGRDRAHIGTHYYC